MAADPAWGHLSGVIHAEGFAVYKPRSPLCFFQKLFDSPISAVYTHRSGWKQVTIVEALDQILTCIHDAYDAVREL